MQVEAGRASPSAETPTAVASVDDAAQRDAQDAASGVGAAASAVAEDAAPSVDREVAGTAADLAPAVDRRDRVSAVVDVAAAADPVAAVAVADAAPATAEQVTAPVGDDIGDDAAPGFATAPDAAAPQTPVAAEPAQAAAIGAGQAQQDDRRAPGLFDVPAPAPLATAVADASPADEAAETIDQASTSQDEHSSEGAGSRSA
jgi:hypothetical protein